MLCAGNFTCFYLNDICPGHFIGLALIGNRRIQKLLFIDNDSLTNISDFLCHSIPVKFNSPGNMRISGTVAHSDIVPSLLQYI